MAKRYIGLEIYDFKTLNDIIENNLCDGLILGDLFCENRMFENGNNDLVRCFEFLSKTKIDIVYQLPYYITSRNRTQILNNLKTLYALKPDSIILITDVGFADLIKKTFTTFRLTWSSMQRNRVYKTNDYTYDFLKKIGIDFIETEEKEKNETIRKCGLVPWLIYGYTRYKTFGRVCYAQQQIGETIPECRKLCMESIYSLKEEKSNYEMTIDGYVLGKNLDYTNCLIDDNETVCIYAKAYEDLRKILKEIQDEKI